MHSLCISLLIAHEVLGKRTGSDLTSITMTSKSSSLPVVDFSAWSLDIQDDTQADIDDLHQLAGKIHRAFCSTGFVYLINHGVKQQQVKMLLYDNVTRISGIEFLTDMCI